MSTKIFDAYRMPRSVDLLHFQARLRELAMPVRRDMDAQQIIETAADRLAVTQVAGVDAAPKSHTPNPVFAAIAEWNKDQRDESPHSAFHDPHRLEVSFVAHGGWIGFKLFTSRPDYASVIAALTDEFDIEEYHYQNQTDQPEGISDEAWSARGKFWDDAVGSKPWDECGLSFVLTSQVSIDSSDIKEHATESMIPSHAELVSRVAQQLVLAVAQEVTTIGPGNIMRLIWIDKYPQDLLDAVAVALPKVTLETLFAPHEAPADGTASDELRALAMTTAKALLAA